MTRSPGLDKRDAEIVALRRAGITQREIARKFDLNIRTVQRIIVREAPDLAPARRGRWPEVILLLEKGLKHREVARQLGLNPKTVYLGAKRHNDALAAAILSDMSPARHITSLGYVRTGHQQALEQQQAALKAAGAVRLFVDDGPKGDSLAALLDYAREGDTVTVVALDRLGRSLSGIVRTVETLQQRGINLRSLREGIDYSTPVGRMVAGIFASLAEYERTLINERAAAAREASRDRGAKLGRKPVLTPEQIAEARRLKDSGETMATIVSRIGASRATIYRALGGSE